jgi:hypothetical protein
MCVSVYSLLNDLSVFLTKTFFFSMPFSIEQMLRAYQQLLEFFIHFFVRFTAETAAVHPAAVSRRTVSKEQV